MYNTPPQLKNGFQSFFYAPLRFIGLAKVHFQQCSFVDGAIRIPHYTYYQVVGPQTNIKRESVEERRASTSQQRVQNRRRSWGSLNSMILTRLLGGDR